jgi:hypothetical protein
MVRGSCLCGGIRFEADAVERMGHCHCSMCRKAHGAAFGTFASVPASAFRFVKGWELVQLYESSPGSHRAFCRVCGSRAPLRSPDGTAVFIPAGLFDDDPGARPAFHMFVGSKAAWWEISDDLPQFEEFPLAPARG